MIRLHQVSKSYGGKTVLEPTDLEVAAGETHVLVGQSGCGKSTLLRIIMGLIPPDGGSVEIEGKTLRPENVRELRHRMGYVIQDGGLFPHLTAAQNVTLLARELGWDAGRCEKRLRELSELVQFPEDGLARYPLQLSGGQRQRVGVMRALMLDPPVLLMDEPLGALDPLIRVRLQDDLKAIFERLRKSVVFVTHDMGEAAFFGDRISVLHQGEVLQSAPFTELARRPAHPYVTEFISAQRREWQAEMPA
jgi:osmoprotectant transport system ATP-binding protein